MAHSPPSDSAAPANAGTLSSSKSAPAVNVWHARKEQMARVQSTQAVLTPSTSTPTPLTPAADAAPPLNGMSHAPSQNDDPFVVRYNRIPPPAPMVTQAPSPVADPESWPEVGASLPSTPANGTHGDVSDKKDEASTLNGIRKSEKPKWVPIPPQELQAAADAQQRSRGPARGGGPRPSSARGVGPSSSGSGSHRASRAPSVSATHTPAAKSPAASTSVSQAQSRAGSVQSSPRLAPRGRRLPGDDGPYRRGSGNSSPQVPPPHPQPYYDMPYGYPPPGGPYAPPGSYYAPPFLPPPMQQAHSTGSPHPYSTGSPMRPTYSLPPVYGGGGELPYPPPGPTSPYGAYPPYPQFGYAPPYPPYWAAPAPPPAGMYSLPSLQHPIPPPPSSSASSVSALALGPRSTPTEGSLSGVPPRSALERPPPPAQSRALAGYREIAPLATPELTSRAMLFGSVAVAGTKSPSPIASPLVGRSRMVGGERPFKTFTIGVVPGGSGPVHTRSGSRPLLDDVPRNLVAAAETEAPEVVDLTEAASKWQFGSTTEPKANVQPPAIIDTNSPIPDPTIGSVGRSPAAGTTELPAHTPAGQSWPPGASDHFQVQDFGYGFGPGSGTGHAEQIAHEERQTRERERAREREQQEQVVQGQAPVVARPRRGSYPGFDRGGYGGRRGRGRGFGGNRGFGRGGTPGYSRGQAPNTFGGTPPHLLAQLPPPGGETVYYAPPPPHVAPFGHPGYEMYYSPMLHAAQPVPQAPPPPPMQQQGEGSHAVPPMPMPITRLPFPLDVTRTYLLGQLEYYLSQENMAQDLYLRTHMDTDGWIAIPLLAGFNRVRTLTPDAALVREVLALSTLAEVRDNHVRMSGGAWRQFVVPNARPSAFATSGAAMMRNNAVDADADAEGEHEHDGEGDEEDDVEFVVGPEATRSWTPTASALA